MPRVEQDVVLGGRYRLLRRIATGGMGTVWEATDLRLHRRVAVKLLSEALGADPTFVERFRREARAAAGLSHPNVARVFDYGDGSGPEGDGSGPAGEGSGPAGSEGPFIVMELIPGRTLAESLDRQGALDPSEAARIAADVARALQAAHDAGVVHRDVKPGNVMITPRGEVKVMDFGIAAAASEAPLTATGAALGTAAYISPEQATGGRATAASDVYALGCVLYELLTGRPPFAARSPVALAAAHAREAPAPVRSLAPGVPPWLARACERALAKDPRDRPPSAAAFAAMLSPPAGSNGHAGDGLAPVPEAPAGVVAAPPAGEVPTPPAGDAPLGDAPPLDGVAATTPIGKPLPTTILEPAAPAPVAAPTAGPEGPVRRAPLPVVARARRRWPTALAAVAVVLVLAALAALGAYLATHSRREPPRRAAVASPARSASPSPIVVPNVVGLSLDRATNRLEALGIPIANVRTAPGTLGEVVRVEPGQGSTLSSGQSVTLYVGAGRTGGGPGGGHGHGRRHGKGKRKKH
jgi:eukaryotic-like serine/threonine-protein kinase